MHLPRAAALCLCVCLACDNPVEPFRPQGQGELLPVNTLFEDAISGGVKRLYSFEVTSGSEYVVLLKSLHGFVGLAVIDPATGYALATIGSAPGSTALEDNPSSNIPTAQAGLLRLEAYVFNGDTARFQFKIVPVNTAPEFKATQFTLGDMIVGETINPRYDTDIFTAHANAGQFIAGALQPLGSNPGGITLYVETADGQFAGMVPASAPPWMSTGAIPVSVSQDYRFVIRSGGAGSFRHRGPYRVWSYLIDPAPDHVATALVPNAVVSGERIDQPNDIDEFTFQDTVGADYLAFFDASRPFYMSVFSPTDSGMGGRVDNDPDTTLLHQGTSLISITSTGAYKIRVWGGSAGQWLMADTGAYRLLLFRADRRPESVPAVFQVGDTVSGEAIYPAGDIDEFTVSATPGQQLKAGFRLLADAVPAYNDLSFEVLDAATNTPLSQMSSQTAGPFVQGFQFTVPTGGALRIRVGRVISSQVPRAPYAFFLSP